MQPRTMLTLALMLVITVNSATALFFIKPRPRPLYSGNTVR